LLSKEFNKWSRIRLLHTSDNPFTNNRLQKTTGSSQTVCHLPLGRLSEAKVQSTLAKGLLDMKPISLKNDKLGFVGIGYMGRPIAQRLLESGFKVMAYDRERTNAERFVRYGGTVAESVTELSTSCNVILSCRANDIAV